MCENKNCAFYGGACGFTLRNSGTPFVICPEYVPEKAETSQEDAKQDELSDTVETVRRMLDKGFGLNEAFEIIGTDEKTQKEVKEILKKENI